MKGNRSSMRRRHQCMPASTQTLTVQIMSAGAVCSGSPTSASRHRRDLLVSPQMCYVPVHLLHLDFSDGYLREFRLTRTVRHSKGWGKRGVLADLLRPRRGSVSVLRVGNGAPGVAVYQTHVLLFYPGSVGCFLVVYGRCFGVGAFGIMWLCPPLVMN